MDDKTNELLERLAVSSLEKCLARLSKVSAGTWRMESAGVRRETLEDALKRHDFKSSGAAAVYFNVPGEFPFASLALFEPDEIEYISKCFPGYFFSGDRALKPSEEVMLLELGNILLNSVVGAVSDGLKKIFMPAVPRYIQGDARRLAGELGAIMDLQRNFRIITLALDSRCGKNVSRSEMFAVIPEELADELERRSHGAAKTANIMKILIVDDNVMIRGMLRDLLEQMGHEVAGEAEESEGAIRVFTAVRPEVVFLDLIMPGKSGIEVLEELRKIDPGAKIVIVTAVEQERMDKKIFEKGVNAIIRKPFSYEELEKTIAQIM
ncbi:MAG: response regulator [Elusimicrobia bacterium]|nr:response regulator [Elusimicrobiota bacterium]